jgi:hypothetical protein
MPTNESTIAVTHAMRRTLTESQRRPHTSARSETELATRFMPHQRLAHLIPIHDILKQVAQPVGVLGSKHQVYLRHATQQLLPLLLRHAPRHHDRHVLPLVLAPRVPAYVRVHLLLRMVSVVEKESVVDINVYNYLYEVM